MPTAIDQQLATDDEAEWIVGIATLPTYVKEKGKAYQPSAIVWLDSATELILDTEIAPPQDALGVASAYLRAVAQRVAAGRSVAPGRIRVASTDLADVLRRAAPDGVEVVCAPTPELDQVIASLIGHVAPDHEPELRYLEGDATADGVAAMFRAAARLYSTKPWDVVPTDTSLIGVTSESLELRDAVISVIGQAGQTYGFLLFASLDDFQQFVDAADQSGQARSATYPHHLALTYARRADVGPALKAEIAAHRWQVAGPRAYPVVTAFNDDGVGRTPTRSELLRMEAIAAALAGAFGEQAAELAAAFAGEAPLELRQLVETSGGTFDVELSTLAADPLDTTLLDELGELDDDRVQAYRDEILSQFAASPEAQAEPEANWSELLVEYAATYFGKTVMALAVAELHEIVFEIIPRKLSVAPTAAPAIIAGLRAFLAFLQREHPGRDADRRLASLGGNAAQQLARLLADTSSYGPAKAFIMSGQAAGFDMSAQAGLDAWAAYMRDNNLSLPMARAAVAAPRASSPAKPTAMQRAKKAKRKAQRAARNKSRSR